MPIEQDSVLLNKVSVIQRALKRMQQEYDANPELNDFTHQDALILNLQRACQAAIDMAQHIIALKHFRIPQSAADGFIILFEEKILSEKTAKELVMMSGFRNLAVHDYQSLKIEIIQSIATKGYRVFERFCDDLGLKIHLTKTSI